MSVKLFFYTWKPENSVEEKMRGECVVFCTPFALYLKENKTVLPKSKIIFVN